MGFLFFLCLLNGGEVGVFETILIFLWGLVVIVVKGCGGIYIKLLVNYGKLISKSCFLGNNQISQV